MWSCQLYNTKNIDKNNQCEKCGSPRSLNILLKKEANDFIKKLNKNKKDD